MLRLSTKLVLLAACLVLLLSPAAATARRRYKRHHRHHLSTSACDDVVKGCTGNQCDVAAGNSFNLLTGMHRGTSGARALFVLSLSFVVFVPCRIAESQRSVRRYQRHINVRWLLLFRLHCTGEISEDDKIGASKRGSEVSFTSSSDTFSDFWTKLTAVPASAAHIKVQSLQGADGYMMYHRSY